MSLLLRGRRIERSREMYGRAKEVTQRTKVPAAEKALLHLEECGVIVEPQVQLGGTITFTLLEPFNAVTYQESRRPLLQVLPFIKHDLQLGEWFTERMLTGDQDTRYIAGTTLDLLVIKATVHEQPFFQGTRFLRSILLPWLNAEEGHAGQAHESTEKERLAHGTFQMIVEQNCWACWVGDAYHALINAVIERIDAVNTTSRLNYCFPGIDDAWVSEINSWFGPPPDEDAGSVRLASLVLFANFERFRRAIHDPTQVNHYLVACYDAAWRFLQRANGKERLP